MSFHIVIYLLFIRSAAVFSKNVKIIGGSDADIRDFPYVASIRYAIDNKHMCGGAIVTHRHILTAAHCFQIGPEDYRELIIVVGSSYLTSNVGSSFLIDTIFIHPMFNGMRTESESLLYDIAVVKVSLKC